MRREKSTVNPVTPRSGILVRQDQKTHLHTCVMPPPTLWLDSDAPEPLSDETLATLEKKQAYMNKDGTDVKMGLKSVTSCLVVLG